MGEWSPSNSDLPGVDQYGRGQWSTASEDAAKAQADSDRTNAELGGVSAGSSMLGQTFSAAAAANNAKNKRDAYQRSATSALIAAGDAIQRAHYAGMQARMQGGLMQGAQQGAESMGGVVVGAGSAATDSDRTRAFSDINSQMIENNAAKEAYGLRGQAANLNTQAAAEDNNITAIEVGAGISILGSMGSLAGSAAS